MPTKKFIAKWPISKKAGDGIARLLGDKKLGAAIYRLRPSHGQNFGLPGVLISRESDYGQKYAARLCVCGRPLSFGRLVVFSDGNSEPRLVHYVCGSRALTWSRLFLAEPFKCFGPSYAAEPEPAEPIDLAPVWASYNRHLEAGAEPAKTAEQLTEQIDRLAIAIAEKVEAGAEQEPEAAA